MWNLPESESLNRAARLQVRLSICCVRSFTLGQVVVSSHSGLLLTLR